jgi:hypothetical protein
VEIWNGLWVTFSDRLTKFCKSTNGPWSGRPLDVLKSSVFWHIMPFNLLKWHLLSHWFLAQLILWPWRLRRHFLLKCWLTFQRTTLHYIPEDTAVHNNHCENHNLLRYAAEYLMTKRYWHAASWEMFKVNAALLKAYSHRTRKQIPCFYGSFFHHFLLGIRTFQIFTYYHYVTTAVLKMQAHNKGTNNGGHRYSSKFMTLPNTQN